MDLEWIGGAVMFSLITFLAAGFLGLIAAVISSAAKRRGAAVVETVAQGVLVALMAAAALAALAFIGAFGFLLVGGFVSLIVGIGG